MAAKDVQGAPVEGLTSEDLNAPARRRKPEPARNPPQTGYGIKRTSCPHRRRPRSDTMRPDPIAVRASMRTTVLATRSPDKWASERACVRPAAMTARMALEFESGPAIEKGKELFSATTRATSAAATSAARKPLARKGSRVGPLKMRTA
jgi:hypothetical protein